MVRPSASGPALEILIANASTQPIVEAMASAVSSPGRVAHGERVAVSGPPALVPGSPAAVHPRVDAIEVTPIVPARVLGLSSEGIDQALLTALVARVVRLSAGFKVGANWTSLQARDAILGLLRSFGCPLWWVSNALDQAERRPCVKMGNKAVESWGFVRQIVSNWTRGDGTPGSPPGSQRASPPAPPAPAVPSRDGKPSRPPSRSSMDAIERELHELDGGRAARADRRAGGDAGQPVVIAAAAAG